VEGFVCILSFWIVLLHPAVWLIPSMSSAHKVPDNPICHDRAIDPSSMQLGEGPSRYINRFWTLFVPNFMVMDLVQSPMGQVCTARVLE
jgi:hypothetical protein